MAMMVRWFLLAVALFVVAEAAALLAVGSAIGVAQALLLMVATSLLGLVVLRHPGRIQLDRMRASVTKDGLGGLQAGGDAFLTVSAGVLLLVPGFITDALAVLLLLPPVRRWIGGRFLGFVSSRTATPGVVDLDRQEWDRVPERRLEKSPPPDRPEPDA
jgi:UPF0716 protein FxsA